MNSINFKYVGLFISIILLTSCSLFTQKQAADIIGTEGLVMTIGKLPAELYQGQGLQIPVTLENLGTSDINGGVLSISGYDENIVHFRPPVKIEGIQLTGKTNFIPGGKRTDFFTISSINLPGAKQTKQTFEVVACYLYKTDASPIVCINPQRVLGKTDINTQACTFDDAQISSSQGAPIAVTKVENWYYLDKNEIEFRIFVKDVSGKGVAMSQNSYAKRCLGKEALRAEDIGMINIEAYLGGQKISCYSVENNAETDHFTILGSTHSVYCRTSLNSNTPAYTTPLTISLSYGYVNLNVFSIDLKNPQFKP